MDDKLPEQKGTEDKKFQELEKELQNLEKRAHQELSQPKSAPPPPSVEPGPAESPTPLAEPPLPPTAKSKIVLWLGLGLLLLALVAAGAYYLGSRRAASSIFTPEPTSNFYPTEAPTPTPTIELPSPEPLATPSATPTGTPSATISP